MIIVLATRNPGKLAEMRLLLRRDGWILRPCQDYPGCPIPPETGRSFAENALRKARAAAAFTQELALGDDSGLEVDALAGAPGVYSARFAGEQATDAANNARLLDCMAGVPAAARTARFRCAVAIALPSGSVWTVEGVCEGRIALAPKGGRGFGYDPLFIPDGHARTFAELDPDTKNRISHRGRALTAARRLLEEASGTVRQE